MSRNGGMKTIGSPEHLRITDIRMGKWHAFHDGLFAYADADGRLLVDMCDQRFAEHFAEYRGIVVVQR